MINVHATTIGECWMRSMNTVLQCGVDGHDADVRIIELMGLTVEIDQPSVEDSIIKKYGDQEILAHTLRKFSKNVVMPDRPFTYGQRIYDKNGVDQFEWLVNRLSMKRETKSATICLLDEGTTALNIPCLTTLDAKIRDEKLNINFFYRSQNIAGRQYANLIAIAKLQRDLAERLSVDIGHMSGYVASAHIYEYDEQQARNLCSLYDADALSTM